MTLHLSNGVTCRSGHGTDAGIEISGIEITMDDFLQAALYVLTNTDLEPEDQRPEFLDLVRRMETRPGFNPGGLRLVLPDSP